MSEFLQRQTARFKRKEMLSVLVELLILLREYMAREGDKIHLACFLMRFKICSFRNDPQTRTLSFLHFFRFVIP